MATMNHEDPVSDRDVPAELRPLLDNHWCGTLVVDDLLRVVYANRAMADFLGQEQGLLAGSYATGALGCDEESWISLLESGEGMLSIAGRRGIEDVPVIVRILDGERPHRTCLFDLRDGFLSDAPYKGTKDIFSHMGPFLDGFKHPIVVSDLDSRILWSNRMAQEEFGITDADESCQDLLGPGTEYDVSLFCQEVMRNEEAKVDELELRNGGFYSIRAFALYEEGAEGIVHYMRDVSEVHRVKGEMERVRRRLDLASRAAGFSSFVHRNGSPMIEIDNVEGLLLSPDEESMVTLDAMLNLVHEDDMGELLSVIERESVPTDDPLSLIFRARFRPGPYQWYRLLATSILDEDGEDYLSGAVFNIDDVVRTQDALRQVNRKLGLLSDITSHDIRNQTTVAMGFAELMRDLLPEQGGEELHKMTSKIFESLSKVHEQLDFAQDYHQLGVHEPRWMDVGKNVESLRDEPALRGTELLNDAEGVKVFADPLFRKVLWNLVENSVRHGGDVKTVRIHSPEHGVLVVEDDGDGVEGHLKQRIFEREVGENTGLGLFLATEILSITSIELSEEGVPGEGATFVLRAPVENFQPAVDQERYRL